MKNKLLILWNTLLKRDYYIAVNSKDYCSGMTVNTVDNNNIIITHIDYSTNRVWFIENEG